MAIATTAYINLELLEVVVLEAAVLAACGFLFFDIERRSCAAPFELRTRRRFEHLWFLVKTAHHSVHYV